MSDQPPEILPSEETPPAANRPRINWLWFAVAFLGPVIASCAAGALDSRNGDFAPGVAVIGGGIGGIVCGAMLGYRLGVNVPVKILLGVVFAGVMAAACIAMCCVGCSVSGYQMSFH